MHNLAAAGLIAMETEKNDQCCLAYCLKNILERKHEFVVNAIGTLNNCFIELRL